MGQVIKLETAKLAKEVGFDQNPFKANDNDYVAYYPEFTDSSKGNVKIKDPLFNPKYIIAIACTQSELKKWLREKYNIEVETYRTAANKEGEKLYGCMGENWNGETEEEFDLFNIYDKDYEEVFEKGLQIALETLKKK